MPESYLPLALLFPLHFFLSSRKRYLYFSSRGVPDDPLIRARLLQFFPPSHLATHVSSARARSFFPPPTCIPIRCLFSASLGPCLCRRCRFDRLAELQSTHACFLLSSSSSRLVLAFRLCRSVGTDCALRTIKQWRTSLCTGTAKDICRLFLKRWMFARGVRAKGIEIYPIRLWEIFLKWFRFLPRMIILKQQSY